MSHQILPQVQIGCKLRTVVKSGKKRYFYEGVGFMWWDENTSKMCGWELKNECGSWPKIVMGQIWWQWLIGNMGQIS